MPRTYFGVGQARSSQRASLLVGAFDSARVGATSAGFEELESDYLSSNRVVFADTDLVPAIETRKGDLVQNETEADLVFQVRERTRFAGEITDFALFSDRRGFDCLRRRRDRNRNHFAVSVAAQTYFPSASTTQAHRNKHGRQVPRQG